MAFESEQVWELRPSDFGPLLEYVQDLNVTDIDLNCNGRELWITDLKRGKYLVENHGCNEDFVEQFTSRIRDHENVQFNAREPVLEAETEDLRISCIHGSAALTGISICIRKSPPIIRLTRESALKEKFTTESILNLLTNCVHAKMNFVFCGEPAAGKTECAKFFSQFIRPEERVITIEDNREFHYKKINKGKDCVELKVTKDEKIFGYSKAIKTCLRQNPDWIMLSEARSTEVVYLLECWSTGISGFTTLHTDDVRTIPDRIKNMVGNNKSEIQTENDIFKFVDVGVLVRKEKTSNGTLHRYIDQVCFFTRENGENKIAMIVEDGKMIKSESGANPQIPNNIKKKLLYSGAEDPYKYYPNL